MGSEACVDWSQFRVGVTGYDVACDGSTFEYRVDLGYGDNLEWCLWKRFSDFHTLHDHLLTKGFCCLPEIPPKRFTRPTDKASAYTRQKGLDVYVKELMRRPDVRCDSHLLGFMEIEAHLGFLIPSLQFTRDETGTILLHNHFAVSDFHFLPELNLIVVAQRDVTPLRKLGRAWSLIEAEHQGRIGVFHLCFDTIAESHHDLAVSLSFDEVLRFGLLQPVYACTLKTQPLSSTEAALQVLTGTEDGMLGIHTVGAVTRTASGFIPQIYEAADHERNIELHIKAPLQQMLLTSTRLCTIGGDNGLKVLTPSIDSVAGGRIVKPLVHSNETLTCMSKPIRSDSAILVGTTSGQLLAYNIADHPPQLMATIDLVMILRELELKARRMRTEDEITKFIRPKTFTVNAIEVLLDQAPSLHVAVAVHYNVLHLNLTRINSQRPNPSQNLSPHTPPLVETSMLSMSACVEDVSTCCLHVNVACT